MGAILPLRAAGKLVILVTHHVHFGQFADTVLALHQDGSIRQCGPPPEMQADAGTHDENTCETKVHSVNASNSRAVVVVAADDAVDTGENKSSEAEEVRQARSISKSSKNSSLAELPVELVRPEERSIGHVTCSTYAGYLAAGGCSVAI